MFSRGINPYQYEDLSQLGVNKSSKAYVDLEANEQNFHDAQPGYKFIWKVLNLLRYLYQDGDSAGPQLYIHQSQQGIKKTFSPIIN